MAGSGPMPLSALLQELQKLDGPHRAELLASLNVEGGGECPTIREIAEELMYQLKGMRDVLGAIRTALSANGEGEGLLPEAIAGVSGNEELKAVSNKCSGLGIEVEDWHGKSCLEALNICRLWLENLWNEL